jgi:hypothetical protein
MPDTVHGEGVETDVRCHDRKPQRPLAGRGNLIRHRVAITGVGIRSELRAEVCRAETILPDGIGVKASSKIRLISEIARGDIVRDHAASPALFDL